MSTLWVCMRYMHRCRQYQLAVDYSILLSGQERDEQTTATNQVIKMGGTITRDYDMFSD